MNRATDASEETERYYVAPYGDGWVVVDSEKNAPCYGGSDREGAEAVARICNAKPDSETRAKAARMIVEVAGMPDE